MGHTAEKVGHTAEKVGHTAEVTFCDGKQFKTSGPWDPAPALGGWSERRP